MSLEHCGTCFSKASKFCVECAHLFCESCSLQHVFTPHFTVDIKLAKAFFCKYHPKEKNNILCCHCKEMVCKDCANSFLNGQHAKHKLVQASSLLNSAIEKEPLILTTYLSELKKKDELINKKLEEYNAYINGKKYIKSTIERVSQIQQEKKIEDKDIPDILPFATPFYSLLIRSEKLEIPKVDVTVVEEEESDTEEPKEIVIPNEKNSTPKPVNDEIPLESIIQIPKERSNTIMRELNELKELMSPVVNIEERKSNQKEIKSYIEIQAHRDTIWSLAYSLKQNIFASASSDKTVKIWDMGLKNCEKEYNIGHAVYSIDFCGTTGEKFFCGLENGNIVGYKGPKVETTLKGHTKSINQIKVKDDFIVSGSSDFNVMLWNHSKKKQLFVFKHKDDVSAVGITDTKFLSASLDNTCKVFDLKTLKPLGTLSSESGFSSLCFFDSNTLVTGHTNGKIDVFDLRVLESTPIKSLEGHGSEVKCLDVSCFDTKIISGSLDTTLKLWDMKGKDDPLVLNGHSGAVRSVISVNDDIVSASDDLELRCWKV